MTAVPNSIGDYLGDLDAAHSAEDCMTITRRHVGQLGFRNVVFTYSKRSRNVPGEVIAALRYSSIPPAWEERYRDMGYQNHCPILREGLNGGSLPLIWQDIWDRVDKNAKQRQMVSEAAELGVVHGVSIPIRMPNGDICGVGVSTDLGSVEAQQVIEAHLPMVFLMSHHLHAVIADRYLMQTDEDENPRLTNSELDCLHWVAEGKGTWEISKIQGVSENTVKYHLRNILSKLNVNNRPAAVARAFRLGLMRF